MVEGQDYFTTNEFKRSLKEFINNEYMNTTFKQIRNVMLKNPEKFWKLELVQKLWAKELLTVGFGVATSVLLQIIWGEQLNSSDIETLDGVYYLLPPEQKDQLETIIKNNLDPQSITKIVNDPIVSKITSQVMSGIKLNQDTLRAYYNNCFKDILSKNNLNDDLIFSDDTSSTILVQDSSKLIKKGYIRVLYHGYKGERAHTRQIVFKADMKLEDIIAISGESAPYLQENQPVTSGAKGESMNKRSKKVSIKSDSKLETREPGYQLVKDDRENQLNTIKQLVGIELFSIALEQAGKNATPADIERILSKMLS
jgi:hypothetical protein